MWPRLSAYVVARLAGALNGKNSRATSHSDIAGHRHLALSLYRRVVYGVISYTYRNVEVCARRMVTYITHVEAAVPRDTRTKRPKHRSQPACLRPNARRHSHGCLGYCVIQSTTSH